ncbi:MAG: response regulator [Blastocatellia bacterium]
MKNKQTSILIVDNQAPTRQKLAAFLASEHSCATAATAEEAMGLLSFCPFDLVITDRELSGASGLALCQFIQRARPDTPVILMSKRITPWQRSVAERLGVFDCIGKPCSLLSLPDLIERALLTKTPKNDFKTRKSPEIVYQTA